MENKLMVLFVAAIKCILPLSQTCFTPNDSLGYKNHAIVIKIRLDPSLFSDSLMLDFVRYETPGAKWVSISVKPVKNAAVWCIYSEKPILVNLERRINKQKKTWMLEPGDDIEAEYDGSRFKLSGAGSEKLTLQEEMDSLIVTINKPKNPNQWLTKSLQDFLEMHRYSTQILASLLPLIDSYKHKLSTFAYNTIRVNTISRYQEDKLDKFSGLVKKAESIGVSRNDLCAVFDSCFYNSSWKWVLENDEYGTGWYAFIRWQVRREYGFEHGSIPDEAKRKLLYYERGKETYSGIALQRFLYDLIANHTIHEVGFTSDTEKLLRLYYNDPDVHPEFKQYVKTYELDARKLVRGKLAPGFSLTDKEGRDFTKSSINGKIALMDFWFTGCVGCLQMTPAIKKIQEHFKGDSNIAFLSISTDKDFDKWRRSLREGKYTSGFGVDLYTGGQGNDHPMMAAYSITSYPSLHLIDGFGKIVQSPLPDPRHDGGKKLIDLIHEQALLMKDGPYVISKNGLTTAYTINFSSVLHHVVNKNMQQVLMVQTDKKEETFPVELKPVLEIEPSEYKQPKKLFALSDIEGNFDVLRMLLQSNGVIDSNYNWTFEDGHLVINGDIFDRGNQVTECLWLIYSLEEKAKKENGYVHFILGNHEIMNLSGDHRYIQQKYRGNAFKLNKRYSELYDRNSELGKWLRTKNVIEKIGNLLFTHAGISAEVNELSFSIRQLNEIARPFYDNDSVAKEIGNTDLNILFDSGTSPFWYRLYYQDLPWKVHSNGDTTYKASLKQINETLSKFSVDHIITGHTIVADSISVHFGGKVLNTDAKHAEGKGEALLIESNGFYRVDMEGAKHLLFKDDFRKTSDGSVFKPSSIK